ncbi:AAA family ATPase [Leptolyngbya cf. ectocarpi LEGE 11479]|uniref:AAA family ATPase n=1 Tax=Leptolyngbya cf. ectocarpi LEGE 11479 TaxID=1828722 RepID=A0A928ZXJ0_LEPEC|nr:AAA family ATPase [Leptolyngbya ectocarpi]MBE9069284.1 AAA family ATPase [Leptolyngbya cf. ectocarpi LEGE 11479]
MNTIPIPIGSLVLLSGAPGAGKTTACQHLPPELVLSSDTLRQTFFGTAKTLVDGQVTDRPLATDDRLIFSTLENIVRARLKAGLTTVVDATLISDKERKPFATIAEELGVPVQVIIFNPPVEQVQQQNQQRRRRVPKAVVARFCDRIQLNSHWPFTLTLGNTTLTVQIPTIPDTAQIDVIGDVHGLADTLQAMLHKLGYDLDLNHPDGRQLCFLGDLVDRGPQSLEVLDLVMQAVAKGHYCVRGNHDNNLARGLRGDTIKSKSTRGTLHKALQRDNNYQNQVRDFIQSLPSFYRYRHYVLCHGDIEWFDPVLQPDRERVYGRCRMHETHDTDGIFRQTSDLSVVRGHIPLTSQGDRTYSLEMGAGFGGPLAAMRLPEQDRVEVPCAFDYSQRPPSFAAQMDPLVSKKLVKRVNNGPLTLFKYSSRAFFSPTAWDDHPELKLARGVVVGLDGTPVSQPFPRTFNYLERDTTLPHDTDVIAVEKLNGFLVSTFLHPYDPNQVVTTCSGSFQGEYVEYAKSLLFRKGLYGRVLTWLQAHRHVTLLWEAIHPNDPHIIQYGPEDHGLHLIGAGVLGAGFMSEEELDAIASSLQTPRPTWFPCTFGDAISKSHHVEHEGFMIRLATDGTFALKLKSPYYLRTKFLARLNPKKCKFMYAQPQRFKQELDEAFWPLVDAVTSQITQETWLRWTDIERRDFVQTWMNEVYK